MEMTFRGSWSSRSIRGTTAMPKPRGGQTGHHLHLLRLAGDAGAGLELAEQASTVSRIPEPLEKET